MTSNFLRIAIRIFLSSSVIMGAGAPASGETNCNTALSRIAKTLAQKAISDHKNDACSGLKKGPFGVDKTTKLEMSNFKLCEDGPVVSAEVTVEIECQTSGKSLISATIGDTISASASADLDRCQVLDTSVSAERKLAQAGLNTFEINKKLKEAAAKEIKPYCK